MSEIKVNFANWLKNELDKREWSQTDLTRHIVAAGHKISRSQISHILNEDRLPTGEICVALAAGLGIEREEVFRVRGWLPYSSKEFDLKLSSDAAQVVLEANRLPAQERRIVWRIAKATLDTLREEMQRA